MGVNKARLIECHVCGKSFDRGNFFRPLDDDKICCDCFVATQPDGMVECKTCAERLPLNRYKVLTWLNSTASSKRSLSCNDCCDKMKEYRHKGGGRESTLRKKIQPCNQCGEPSIDWLKGEYLCAKCLNPEIEPDTILNHMGGSRGLYGSAFSMCEESGVGYGDTMQKGKKNGARQ